MYGNDLAKSQLDTGYLNKKSRGGELKCTMFLAFQQDVNSMHAIDTMFDPCQDWHPINILTKPSANKGQPYKLSIPLKCGYCFHVERHKVIYRQANIRWSHCIHLVDVFWNKASALSYIVDLWTCSNNKCIIDFTFLLLSIAGQVYIY